MNTLLESWQAKIDAPFAVIGVRTIPVGAVFSYLQVAKRVGSTPRPVGTACGANHIPILIPCHRVVGSQGIGGFMNARRGAAIDVKRWLLHHENPAAY